MGPPKPKHPSRRKYSTNSARDPWAPGVWDWVAIVSVGCHCVKDRDPRRRDSVGFLLGDIHFVSLGIDRQAMHLLLRGDIAQLAKVCWIVLLKHGNGAVIAGHVDSFQ